MRHRYEAPGLTADWLNGWLAAIGVTVLLDGVRLSWADRPVPFAVFEMDEEIDLVQALAESLPTEQTLADSTIARKLPEAMYEFPRKVTLESFRERAALERRMHGSHLATSVSDLRTDAELGDCRLPR